MNNVELVIFDCDGVLVDSEIIACQIEVELLASSGYIIAPETLAERFSGLNWKTILQIIERESRLDLMDKLLDRAEGMLDERLPLEVKAINGVTALLDRLELPRCVCSNTKMDRLLAMLSATGLLRYFEPKVFSAKDLGEGRSKPRPDIFLHGAERMGIDPARTIVIEDSVHGVQAARAAGMRVIGFTGGSHSYNGHATRLIEHGAATTISNMRDLFEMMADYLSA